jgi:hypothetical protein
MFGVPKYTINTRHPRRRSGSRERAGRDLPRLRWSRPPHEVGVVVLYTRCSLSALMKLPLTRSSDIMGGSTARALVRRLKKVRLANSSLRTTSHAPSRGSRLHGARATAPACAWPLPDPCCRQNLCLLTAVKCLF